MGLKIVSPQREHPRCLEGGSLREEGREGGREGQVTGYQIKFYKALV